MIDIDIFLGPNNSVTNANDENPNVHDKSTYFEIRSKRISPGNEKLQKIHRKIETIIDEHNLSSVFVFFGVDSAVDEAIWGVVVVSNLVLVEVPLAFTVGVAPIK